MFMPLYYTLKTVFTKPFYYVLQIQSTMWKGRFPVYAVFLVNIQLSNSTSFCGAYYRQCWVKTLLHKMFFIFRLQTDEDREKNGSEEDDDEKPGKRVIGPRKKFHWDDTIRYDLTKAFTSNEIVR